MANTIDTDQRTNTIVIRSLDGENREVVQPLMFHNRPFNVGLTDTVCPTLTSECSKMPGMTLVEPKAYGISSYDSNAMKSSNPHSGIYEADTSRTLDLNGGNPGCNQGG